MTLSSVAGVDPFADSLSSAFFPLGGHSGGGVAPRVWADRTGNGRRCFKFFQPFTRDGRLLDGRDHASILPVVANACPLPVGASRESLVIVWRVVYKHSPT